MRESHRADVAELADALGSGQFSQGSAGSSSLIRAKIVPSWQFRQFTSYFSEGVQQ
jgi:hypothetical protein